MIDAIYSSTLRVLHHQGAGSQPPSVVGRDPDVPARSPIPLPALFRGLHEVPRLADPQSYRLSCCSSRRSWSNSLLRLFLRIWRFHAGVQDVVLTRNPIFLSRR